MLLERDPLFSETIQLKKNKVQILLLSVKNIEATAVYLPFGIFGKI